MQKMRGMKAEDIHIIAHGDGTFAGKFESKSISVFLRGFNLVTVKLKKENCGLDLSLSFNSR